MQIFSVFDLKYAVRFTVFLTYTLYFTLPFENSFAHTALGYTRDSFIPILKKSTYFFIKSSLHIYAG